MDTTKPVKTSMSAGEAKLPLVTEGTTLYYATLYLPETIRSQVLLLHALHNEISHIPLTCSDPGVAHIKLEWWREEVERIKHCSARHPLGKQLQSLTPVEGIDTGTINRIIKLTEDQIAPPEIISNKDWRDLIDTGPGLPWSITSRLCGISDTSTQACIDTIIRYSIWTELLQNFYPLVLKGRCYISEKRLKQFKLNVPGVMRDPSGTEVKTLLRSEYTTIVRQLDSAYKELPRTDRRAQLPLLILCRLNQALCKEILKAPMPDPLSRNTLTPLRRSWITWCTSLANR